MQIPETRKDLTLRQAGDGRYIATWQVSLAGPWQTTVIVKKDGTNIGRKRFVLVAYSEQSIGEVTNHVAITGFWLSDRVFAS